MHPMTMMKMRETIPPSPVATNSKRLLPNNTKMTSQPEPPMSCIRLKKTGNDQNTAIKIVAMVIKIRTGRMLAVTYSRLDPLVKRLCVIAIVHAESNTLTRRIAT